MANPSIVEFFDEHSGYKCGYCKSPDTNYCHGMWAHSLTVNDYQDLIDRGWRRSGKYCYKPTMNLTCCPMYTIKCSVESFKPTKSQKKVLKRMNNFLINGKESNKQMEPETAVNIESETLEQSENAQNYQLLQRVALIAEKNMENKKVDLFLSKESETSSISTDTCPKSLPSPSKPIHSKNTPGSFEVKKENITQQPKKGMGPDPNKPTCRKSKELRKERKLHKIAERSKNLGVQDMETTTKDVKEKTIEEFLATPNVEKPAHKLEVKLVRCYPANQEFKEKFEKEFKLYQAYQISVHNDKPEDCDAKCFKEFLVTSPLEIDLDSKAKPSSFPYGFGSFHQQYWLDGKLIAVGVIDILPHCVSSVYLFYDPEYSFLSLGTYAALREISFTRELMKLNPDIASYYMGFYIHSCPKMRYKAQFYPSFLLCPETYTWNSYDKCSSKLDISKYSRLNDDPNESDKNGEVVLNNVMVLYHRRINPYSVYLEKSRAADLNQVENYAKLVGRKCYCRMLLYRN